LFTPKRQANKYRIELLQQVAEQEMFLQPIIGISCIEKKVRLATAFTCVHSRFLPAIRFFNLPIRSLNTRGSFMSKLGVTEKFFSLKLNQVSTSCRQYGSGISSSPLPTFFGGVGSAGTTLSFLLSFNLSSFSFFCVLSA
jgi:hypothetical protein